MYRIILFLLISVFSYAQEIKDLYVEASVHKVERKWSSNPLTGLPIRITPAVEIKIHKIEPRKRTPLENDEWSGGDNVTYIGKGYRLDPVDSESDSQTKEIINSFSGDETHRVLWSGSLKSEKFLIRAKKIWSAWKGNPKLRGVISIQKWQKDGEPQLTLQLDAAEISHGKKLHREYNYRELWSEAAMQQENFQEVYSSEE